MSSAWLLNPRNALLVALSIVAALYLALVIRAALRGVQVGDRATPSAGGIGTGFVTNFFDTLGIGSFATTTTVSKSTTKSRNSVWFLT